MLQQLVILLLSKFFFARMQFQLDPSTRRWRDSNRKQKYSVDFYLFVIMTQLIPFLFLLLHVLLLLTCLLFLLPCTVSFFASCFLYLLIFFLLYHIFIILAYILLFFIFLFASSLVSFLFAFMSLQAYNLWSVENVPLWAALLCNQGYQHVNKYHWNHVWFLGGKQEWKSFRGTALYSLESCVWHFPIRSDFCF